MKKKALFVFNGDPKCYIHVKLNAQDKNDLRNDANEIEEGAATKLIPDLAKPQNPLHNLWEKTKKAGLVAGVCKACAGKMETLEAAQAQELSLLADVAGHPAMAHWRDAGYEIVSF